MFPVVGRVQFLTVPVVPILKSILPVKLLKVLVPLKVMTQSTALPAITLVGEQDKDWMSEFRIGLLTTTSLLAVLIGVAAFRL